MGSKIKVGSLVSTPSGVGEVEVIYDYGHGHFRALVYLAPLRCSLNFSCFEIKGV